MTITRQGLVRACALTVGLPVLLGTLGCATSGNPDDQRVRVVQTPDKPVKEGGISPDKQAEIQLLLQQREPSTLKCYADVLNEKHDRSFKGSVTVLLTIEPSGQASDVKIINSTLNDKEVHDCLIAKLKEFEYPQVQYGGTVEYVYHFEPAY